MTSAPLPDAPTATRRRRRSAFGPVHLDATLGWPRRLSTLAWLPIVAAAIVWGDSRPMPPVILVVGLVVAAIGWLPAALRAVVPRWLFPAGLAVMSVGGCLLMYGVGGWSTAATFPVLAAHLAGFRMPLRTASTVAGVIGVAMVVALWSSRSAIDYAFVVVGLIAAVLLGVVRRDAARREAEHEQALVADARVREEHARAEAIAERARIARDVHDVLAHSLSALAVQLQGARLMAQRDGAAADTIAQIERAQGLATDGLTEARRAVRALREGPSDLAAAVRSLVAEHAGATADVQDVGPLGPREAETVLRVAQEALSNVRKHAPGAPVHVRLHRDSGGTELEVTDVTGTPPSPDGGDGYGLVGMGERADLVGATLDAGPTPRGWRVALRIPAPEESPA